MTIIDNLTDASFQTTDLILPDNTVATLMLSYRPRTKRWVADVGYAPLNFQVYGLALCCFPNVLRAWRNILPFGLGSLTSDGTDPFDINDFATGRVTVLLLTAPDVEAVETKIIGAPA